MDAQIAIGIVGSTISLGGISTSYIIMIRKHRRENAILKKQALAEIAATKKAEKERFYLTAAANLVASADKLELSGPQKKDYVMLWLENEARIAEIEVDKPLMSVAVERTILILNDFKDKKKPVSDLLTEELDISVERERVRIAAEAAKAQSSLNTETARLDKNSKMNVRAANEALDNVKNILR